MKTAGLDSIFILSFNLHMYVKVSRLTLKNILCEHKIQNEAEEKLDRDSTGNWPQAEVSNNKSNVLVYV